MYLLELFRVIRATLQTDNEEIKAAVTIYVRLQLFGNIKGTQPYTSTFLIFFGCNINLKNFVRY